MTLGHWKTLSECQKLTQSQLIPGVVEEDIKRNGLLDRIAVAQAKGKSIKWNREKVTLESAVAGANIGDQLAWTSDVEYDAMEVELKRLYIQRVLDKFVPDVYGTINNYEAQVLWEMKKGIVRKINDALLYNDIDYGSAFDFDGIHAWAAVQTGTDLDIDEGNGALSLANLRTMSDAMKHGIDFYYFPYVIARRLDEAYQEGGFTLASTFTMGRISYGIDEAGRRIMFWDGVPILRTDYLVGEGADTGKGSNLRTKTGSTYYSIFALKMGDVFNGEPGLTLGFGNTEMVGQFYKIELFDKLEDYDAGGMRLVSYLALLLGSKMALGRIIDITDASITA